METRTIVGIGVIALLAYYLFKGKKVVTLADIKVVKNPSVPRLPTQPIKVTVNNKVDDVVLRKSPLLIEDIRVPVKRPIFIPATNSIPNVYDRGVGQPLAFSASAINEDSYYNMAGVCSESTQNACRCSVERVKKNRLEIPQLP